MIVSITLNDAVKERHFFIYFFPCVRYGVMSTTTLKTQTKLTVCLQNGADSLIFFDPEISQIPKGMYLTCFVN